MGGIFSLFSSKTNDTNQNHQGRSYIGDGNGHFGGKKITQSKQ